MTVLTKEVTQIINTYIASDGKEFSDKHSCMEYEITLTATPVFIVYKRGQRSNEVEVFSSYAKALKSLENVSPTQVNYYIIDKIFVDHRLLVDKLKKECK